MIFDTHKLALSLCFTLTVTDALSMDKTHGSNTRPGWVQHLDGCYLDSKRNLGSEGIAALTPGEVVAYCVTRNPDAASVLTSRTKPQPTDPFRINVFFIDAADGHILQTANWPTQDERENDIFPVNNDFFLLATGNFIQLIERKTLSTSKILVLADTDPGKGCQPRKVVGSIDGTSFAVSQICGISHLVSEITAYTTADFQKFADWTSQGVNFYDLFGTHLLRWSTANSGRNHDLFLFIPGVGETTLRSRNWVGSNHFLGSNEILCSPGSSLDILSTDGQQLAYRAVDPRQNPSNPKVVADQIFVSRTGQRVGALIFHVPWVGALRWECAVFDRDLHPLLTFTIPSYHDDFTAVLSADDKYVFILGDAEISASKIPVTPAS